MRCTQGWEKVHKKDKKDKKDKKIRKMRSTQTGWEEVHYREGRGVGSWRRRKEGREKVEKEVKKFFERRGVWGGYFEEGLPTQTLKKGKKKRTLGEIFFWRENILKENFGQRIFWRRGFVAAMRVLAPPLLLLVQLSLGGRWESYGGGEDHANRWKKTFIQH